MTSIDPTHTQAQARSGANPFYFAAWRWHFYAGLFVIPFFCILAVTGMLMLWISWVDGRDGERTPVIPQEAALAVSQQAQAATAAIPGGTLKQYVTPRSRDLAAIFRVDLDGEANMVVVDPYTAQVLEIFPRRSGWYDFADGIHSNLMLGVTGDRMLEIAASLGMVLIAIVLAFFLVSGLAWAGIWGEKMVQAWSQFPAEKWANVPLSDDIHASMNHDRKEVPWALELTPMPASGSHAGHAGVDAEGGRAVDIDTLDALAREIGFDARYQLNLPNGEAGVWTINRDSMNTDDTDPTSDRTVHVDQYTGNILADVRYADYSLAGKAMAVGIALHMGTLGLCSVLANTVFCLSVLFLCVSSVVMWWKRRPVGAGGRLAAPPLPRDMPMWQGAVLVGLALSLAFPLAGLTLITVLALDVLVLQRLPALRRLVS